MPVKGIELVIGHQINEAFDFFHREKMTGNIQMQSAPLKVRIIFHKTRWQGKSIFVALHQLHERSHGVITRSIARIRNRDASSHIDAVGVLFDILQLFEL